MADKEWTTQQRNEAPSSTFCGPGKSFPVESCSDVSHARSLLHHAKAGSQSSISSCVEGKAKSMNCANADSPDKGKANNAMTEPAFGDPIAAFAVPVLFAGASPTRVLDDEGMVVRKGKIFGPGTFRPGNFNHDITMTPEHTAIIAENASGKRIDISLGHPTSNHPLKGRMGYTAISEVADNGDIIGESHTPVWLEDEIAAVMGDQPVGVSVELDLNHLDLNGVTLALDQVLPDAQLTAAFAKSQGITPAATFAPPQQTAIGMKGVQKLHDRAVKMGAVCRKPSANMASRTEANLFQQVHDMCSDNGAQCDDMLGGAGSKGWSFTPKPAARAIQSNGRYARGEMFMGIKKFFKRPEVAAAAAEEGIDPEQLHFAEPEAPVTTAATVLNNGRLEAVERELAAQRQENTRLKAEAWAATEIGEGRSMPADEKELISWYCEAAADDELNPVAKFANGDAAPSRLERLVTRMAKRTRNYLSEDMLPDDLDAAKLASVVTNVLETKGKLDITGRPVTDDLAERNPEEYRRTSPRYKAMMAEGAGDLFHEEPSLAAAFAQMVEDAVTRANAKK